MPPYKVLISIEILQLERPSSLQRREILRFLESLADEPYRKGDYEERDDVGRPVQTKIISSLALTYWADHAVKEVKVIRVERADRK